MIGETRHPNLAPGRMGALSDDASNPQAETMHTFLLAYSFPRPSGCLRRHEEVFCWPTE